MKFGLHCDELTVADIGCNAGTQSQCWLAKEHTVHGLDISSALIELAQHRNAQYKARATFEVGSATKLPWTDESHDVCLLPELLEHVEDWKACLYEAVRILKPGGTLYLTTTNVLCPIQQEFNLPLYSWYPHWVKQHFIGLATTTAPELVNFATYPALHWFSPYSLQRFLNPLGIKTLDRFDIMNLEGKSRTAQAVVTFARKASPLRLLGHTISPLTIVVGHKLGSASSPL